jgi:hypothetical protein
MVSVVEQRKLNYTTCYASVFLKNRLREERGQIT